MAYSGGDQVNAIVADVGSYATKIGFAGEDYPRSYFRSNVAVQREDASKKEEERIEEEGGGGGATKRQRRRPIVKVKYDYYTRPLDGDTDGDWEVANPVDPTTGLWYDDGVYENGGGADWHDLMGRMLNHGFDSSLGTTPMNHPLLLAERSYNPPPIRQQVLEFLMEDLNVPAAFLARDATLACYATGRTTGTVVDVGYSGTVVTPVYDGYVEQKGIRRGLVGGLAMDERVLQSLDGLTANKQPFLPLYQLRQSDRTLKRKDAFHTLARLDVARQCKEDGPGAAVAASGVEHSYNAPHVPYELPDGQKIDMPGAQRFAVANLLFGRDEESTQKREDAVAVQKKDFAALLATASNVEEDKSDENKDKFSEDAAVGLATRRNKSSRLGKETTTTTSKIFSNRHLQRACAPYLQNQADQVSPSAVPALVCDAAFRCDRDQQAQLLGNVILCGGGACLGPTDQAVPDMLREQVEAIIHTHTPGWRVKVLSPSVQERAICNWLGGSILGSLGTFHDMWITRAEYEEWGSAIVNRKCP